MAEPDKTIPMEADWKEELVAYLDGELDPDGAARVESQLATDPSMRRELQALEQVWDALDELPREEVAQDFTHSTMEMVAQGAEEDLSREMSAVPARRRLHWFFAGLVGILSTLAGLAIASFLWPNPNEQLVADLPILLHLDEYRAIEDIGYLRRLHESGAFHTSSDDVLPEVIEIANSSTADRRQVIEQMSPAKTDELRRDWERFQKEPPETKLQWRDLHRSLMAEEDAKGLAVVMENYYGWFQSQSPSLQRELLAMPSAQRAQRAISLKQEQDARLRAEQMLTDKDIEGILGWLMEKVKARLDDRRGEGFLHWIEKRGGSPRDRLARLMMFMGRGRIRSSVFENLPANEWQDLIATLTEATRTELEKSGAEPEQKKVLANWIQATMNARFREYRKRRSDLSYDQLREMYEELKPTLSPEERDEIEALPPQEMLQRIMQKYSERKDREEFRRFGPPFGPPFGPGRDGRDGRDRRPGPKFKRNRRD